MSEQGLLYIDDMVVSMAKAGKGAAGDFYICQRNESYTDFILCDGIGSGIKAGIAARMCASRISGLLSGGISPRKTAEKIVAYMHGIRDRDMPYSVFLITRILNDGNYTIWGYEMPVPLVLYDTGVGKASVIHGKYSNEIIYECSGTLKPGSALLMCSDGITQSGMGRGLPMGWTEDGLREWLDRKVQSGNSKRDAANEAFSKALQLSCGAEDDMTLVLLECRKAVCLDILTGPPAMKNKDRDFAMDFLSGHGWKVVCGSSTMDMLARVTGKKVSVSGGNTFSKPPEYFMEGIDYAAEGAVTLNQLYNIINEDRSGFDEKSVVTSICELMQDADIIRIYLGDAHNEGHGSIVFRQTGILPREVIVPLIVEKLLSKGKIVSVIKP